MDIKDIKKKITTTKSLLMYSKDEGIFVEFEDDLGSKGIFEVTYDSDDPNSGDFKLKPNVKLEDIKKLPKGVRNDTIKVSNLSDSSWEESNDFKVNKGPGLCLRTEKNHNVWTVCKPIGITLLKHTNANIDQIQTSASKDLTSVRQEDYGIKGKKDQRFNKVSASVEISIQDDFNSKHDNGEHINSNFDTAQYLKPGRDGESFFYEGSETDKTGASFKVEYENCSMKGQYDLIIDINNLRTISSGFRREVIKMISDGTTLRAASSFITVEKGNAHFSKDDGVWLVDKPLIIKLIK